MTKINIMTKISAKVIADSRNEFGNRITTMVVTFPRFILAELNTHRMMSRNSASSRAIPFEKMLESVQNNPFIPIAWQKKGMQGTEYLDEKTLCKFWNGQLTDTDATTIKGSWLEARDRAVENAKYLSESEVTKQLCNRLLEPFMWHTVIITATEWENFFALRCPRYTASDDTVYRSRKDMIKELPAMEKESTLEWLKVNKGQAEIHMMALAEAIWDAMNESIPKELKTGEWHIPFGDGIEMSILDQQEIADKFPSINSKEDLKIRIATARCARVSYTVVGEEGKEPNYENDIKLHDRLAESGHWSPFEHCARVITQNDLCHAIGSAVAEPEMWSGNFKGFIQYRKTFSNENITK